MPLRIYTVYDHPSDYPEAYVVRCHEVDKKGRITTIPGLFMQKYNLEDVVNQLRNMGLYPIGRMEDDDPVILGCWV